MLLIDFAFLGKNVKIVIEKGGLINRIYEKNETLEYIKGMHNSLLEKDEEKFKGIFEWCKYNSYYQTKTGRHMLFVF